MVENIKESPTIRLFRKLSDESEDANLSKAVFKIAIKEVFFEVEAPIFETKYTKANKCVDMISELYVLLKNVLEKIRDKTAKEDMEFLKFFLMKPWDIIIDGKESFDQFFDKAWYIIKKILGDPPMKNKSGSIKKLILSIQKFNEDDFKDFILKIIPKFRSNELYNLIEKKDDLALDILSSTEHEEVLSTLDLIKNMLCGVDSGESMIKLCQLFVGRHTSLLLQSLMQISVSQLMYGKGKDKSKCIARIYKLLGPKKDQDISGLITSLADYNYRSHLKGLVFDLEKEGTENCLDLAKKSKRIGALVWFDLGRPSTD